LSPPWWRQEERICHLVNRLFRQTRFIQKLTILTFLGLSGCRKRLHHHDVCFEAFALEIFLWQKNKPTILSKILPQIPVNNAHREPESYSTKSNHVIRRTAVLIPTKYFFLTNIYSVHIIIIADHNTKMVGWFLPEAGARHEMVSCFVLIVSIFEHRLSKKP